MVHPGLFNNHFFRNRKKKKIVHAVTKYLVILLRKTQSVSTKNVNKVQYTHKKMMLTTHTNVGACIVIQCKLVTHNCTEKQSKVFEGAIWFQYYSNIEFYAVIRPCQGPTGRKRTLKNTFKK